MVITIATGIYPPDIGGPATYCRRLATELTGRGHEVRVITYSDSDAVACREEEDRLRVTRVGRNQVWPLRYFRFFLATLREARSSNGLFNLDAVGAGLPVMVADWWLRKPLLLRVVADFAWEMAHLRGSSDSFEAFQDKRAGALFETIRAVQRWVTKRADRVIVPSDYMRRTLLRWGVDPARLTVIPNAVESTSERYQTSREQARRRLEIDGPAVLAVGRLIPLKGYRQLIDMMPHFLARSPSLKLTIVGSGPEESRLRNRVRDLELESSVCLVGELEYGQVVEYYRASDLYVLTSEHEAFPHVVLEAMREGLVPVAYAVGGVPEIIDHGVNGMLVSIDEPDAFKAAVLELLEDGERRRAMGRRAEERSRTFNWSDTMKKTLSVMEEVFGLKASDP
jgi:glycosyltransferase involved in cell wall biosynthesis